MEYLSWLFFCLSPFVLFASDNGTGLISCPVFIILGFVFKYIAKKSKTVSYTDEDGKKNVYKIETDECGNTKLTAVVEPQNFWEWHFKQRLNEKIHPNLNATNTPEMARDWANQMCMYHGVGYPSDEKFEQICKEMGLKTKKVKDAEDEVYDRIQAGKFLLLDRFEKIQGTPWDRINIIKMEKKKLYFKKTGHCYGVGDFQIWSRFKKDTGEVWNSLTQKERDEATKWFEEWKNNAIKNVK